MIEVSGLTKRFGKTRALNNIALQCHATQCMALIGPNGCGKTTLIKCILGMVMPDAGSIKVMQQEISGDWKYRKAIGYMPQIGKYPENMKIGQVMEMLTDIRKADGALDEDLVQSFSLRSLYNKRMGTLSGGTMQKVSAAIAFLFHPQILILDEPTAGLDPVSSEILQEKIRTEKQKGKLFIITSHVLSELDELVSDVVYMQDGNILFNKTTDALKSETGENKLSRAIAHLMTRNQE